MAGMDPEIAVQRYERMLGDGDIVRITSYRDISSEDVTEIALMAREIKEYCSADDRRVMKVEIGKRVNLSIRV